MLALLLLGNFTTWLIHDRQQVQYAREIHQMMDREVHSIEQFFTWTIAATEMLAIEIRQSRGNLHDFEQRADLILRHFPGISNLQLAPDGVVEKIYPLQGNENAIGHNILRDDARRGEAIAAINRRGATLAGPFELVQGGLGMVVRNPVFLTGDDEEFWGFASALVLVDDLVDVTDLNALNAEGLSYQIAALDPLSGQAKVFIDFEIPQSEFTLSSRIRVPNGKWSLRVSGQGTETNTILIGGSISLVIAVAAAALVFHLLQVPHRLRAMVQEKTIDLQYMAFNDELTGLPNRRQLMERLDTVIQLATRHRQQAALLFIDLDDFKAINDTRGHEIGDQFLKIKSRRLLRAMRKSDLIARLGGDEFAVVLPEVGSTTDLTHIARNCLDILEVKERIEGFEISSSASVGITIIPKDADDVVTALRNADLAMYAAKHAGKGNFFFYDSAQHSQALAKVQLEAELESAVTGHEFVTHWQPVVDLSSGRICSHEALIRWQHPQRGLLYPDSFIALAESSALITTLGYWIIEHSCALIRDLNTRNACNKCVGQANSIAVNLSPRQLRDEQLVEKVQAILERTEARPDWLEIEITESALMEDLEQSVKTLEALRHRGIRISLDDFGTGYSSLSLLKRLPIDHVKIDRSFVRDIVLDENDQQITQGIIAMAHALNIKVIAEGIETREQLRLLKSYDCDYGQGYYFAKPRPPEECPTDVCVVDAGDTDSC